MGTNYYLHLGKRSAAGKGKCVFTVASEVAYNTATVQDEYGREMSYPEFLDLISADVREYGLFGQDFH